MATLLDARDWDFVVGSVHFVGEHAVDHDGYEVWDHRSQRPDELWRRYFRTLGEAARSGLFDILAHPDLIKIWGPRRPVPEGDLRRFYDLAMDGIAESQIAVEVSTAGLRKPVGELYPAAAFLEMCLDAGCPVALSSDAHVPADVGRDYEAAVELLERLGIGELAVFDRRVRRVEPIG
jgi:histidinol-phosphatase (PHP family)